MPALHDALQRLAEQVRKRLPHVKGEEATKQALILPFLSAMGYDIYDPTEVRPEFVADFAKKKSGGPSEKVDYAIHLAGNPVIFVEAKAAGVELGGHGAQLARYFNSTPSCPVAILSNGTSYRFFTDLEQQNILSEKPFFEFDILAFSENDAEILETFTRERFNPATVREQAEDIIYTSKIYGYIGVALRNPPEGLARFILSEVGFAGSGARRLTAKIVEKFTPTIKRAIQATLLDMATRSIKEQSEPRIEAAATTAAPAKPEPPAAKAAPAAEEKPAEGASQGPNIVTTEDELEGLDIIRSICADSQLSAGAPILFKDTVSWFTISAISIRRWFIRLYFNQKRRSILTNVSQERTKALCPGFEVDGGRVYITSVKDLLRLRPLILHAYEEAVRQKDPAGGDEAS